MSTEPGDIKPQLPPASKPTLPPAPKLSLGGASKPTFRPDTVATPDGQSSGGGAPVAPTAFGIPRAPTLGSPAPSVAAATSAPFPTQVKKADLASIKAVDDAESPKALGAVGVLALVASIAAAVLLFLELKPTL